MLNVLRRMTFALLIGVLLVWSLFPLWYAVVASLSRDTELYQPHFLPPGAYGGNFADLFQRSALLHGMLNGLIVAAGAVGVSLCLGLPAALALARLRFRFRTLVLMLVLGTSLFPQAAVLAGFFEMYRGLGLYNSLLAVVLADLLLVLPFTVWLLRACLKALPRELDDLAALDGATPLVMVRQIFLPLVWPGIAASGVLALVAVWNEFLFAFTFTMTETARTAPVTVALLWGHTPHDQPWGTLMAACVVMTLPAAALVVLFQRKMVENLSAGAVGG